MKLWPPILLLFSISLLSLFQPGCTQVDSPKPSDIQYGGSCSNDFSKDYEAILNWPADQDIKKACDAFYSNYPGMKCFSTVDGIELRIHTSDFDNKCQKNNSIRTKSPKSPITSTNDESQSKASLCSPELTAFIQDKYIAFQSDLESFELNPTRDDDVFAKSLANKKICNQYFFNYKYIECPKDNIRYSFYMLKPYCDQFQMRLHRLRVKNPKKYSPEELKSIVTTNLKFHFKDALVPFTRAKMKVKEQYLVEGLLMEFAYITSNQSYCYFESEHLRFSGELKNDVYKMDVAYVNRNKIVFNHSSFNEQWKMVCQVKDYFYQQDLMETLGDKVSIYE